MKKLKYEVHSLFQDKGDGNYTGPMSPLLFAEEIMEQLDIPYNRLARIDFDDQEIHNWHERGEGWTGCSTLLCAARGKKGIVLVVMLVDMGHQGMPVALWQKKDVDGAGFTSIYKDDTKFAKKLTEEQANEIIQYAIEFDRFKVEEKDTVKYSESQ